MNDNRKYWIIIMISVINSVVVIFLVIQHWSRVAETSVTTTETNLSASHTDPVIDATDDASASSTERYLKRLAVADSLYLAGEYEKAKVIYLEANNISNLYSYPMDKVKLIDTLLSLGEDPNPGQPAKAQYTEDQTESTAPAKPAAQAPLSYHIVVGIFEEANRADKLIQLIGQHGKTAILKPYKNSGRTAVIFDSYSNLEEASKQLPFVKQQISPDAWILRATFDD